MVWVVGDEGGGCGLRVGAVVWLLVGHKAVVVVDDGVVCVVGGTVHCDDVEMS